MSDEGPQARLVDLFGQALDQPEDQRACWARDACADDPDLCRQLLALLQADADRSDPLQQVIDVGADWIDSISLEHVQRLGPWRLLERIGEGGMGTVFLAERDDDEYRRRVAIKLIRGFPDRDRLERLRTERQILADLDHPNIAALLDGGSEQGQPWLAMEYIDGEPLDQWCATRGLSLAERTRLLIRVVEAVHYAHQHLVIHRDIKPGNVLVGGNGEPKLLDFGIAKMIETAEPDDQATRLRYYTPRYSSPEQVEGRAISTLSDVYSLGRLIETVLTAGRDHQTLPREPAAIIECATRIEPSERYSSAGALASDLQRWQDGRAVHALARKRGYRLWRFLVRHRLAVAGGLAGLCVAAALVTRIAVERGEARAAALRAGQTLAFLTGLIESARPEFAQGRDVTVAEVLERGGAQLDAAQSASPDLRAGIATTLASAWQALDEFPKAAELYARAAAEAAAAGDPAEALRARAKTLVAETRAGRSRAVADQAEALRTEFDRLAPDDPALRADVLNDWSVWAIEAGQLEHARAAMLEVVALRQQLDDEAKLAAAENNLALAEDQLGNIDTALALIEQSLARKRRVLGPDHPSTLVGLRVLGVTATRAGQHRRASEALDELLAQRIRLFGADNPVLASDYGERANGLHDAGDYARAAQLYEKALALDAQLAGRPRRQFYLNNLASLHEDRGDFAAAEPLLLESLALREQRYGAEHANTLRVRHNLARLKLRQGRFDEARAEAMTTLATLDRALGAEHRDTRHAEWLLAWIDWSTAPGNAEHLIEASDAVLVKAAPTSLRGLSVRDLRARTLAEAGRLAEARSEIDGLINDYRRSFGDGHPKAAELELELARIDLAEARRDAAQERLLRAAPILDQALLPGAPARELLGCLQASMADPSTMC